MTPARPTSRPLTRRISACVLSAWLGLAASNAGAACIASSDPVAREYERRIGHDPESVVTEVSSRLASTVGLTKDHRAAMYGVLAEAQASLERYAEAREAAELGLTLVDDPRSAVYANLLHYGASNSFDEESRPRAQAQTQTALEMQAPDSPQQACLLIALGVIEHLAGQTDQASIHLTRAYRMSASPGRDLQRINAAEVLSMVMRDLHDFPQALALNEEVIQWYQANSPFRIALARFMRGAILRELGDNETAIQEFALSRQLGVETNDQMGIAYADLMMCGANIDLGALAVARVQCDSALRAFARARSADPMKQALTSLAELDLLQLNPASALSRLDRVLDQQGRDIAPVRLARIHELRAEANRKLGRAEAALADYRVYMERYKLTKDAENAQQAAALRAQFETDREIERNAFLQRELEIKNERLKAQSARMHWMVVSAVAGTGLITLLTYLLVTAGRKRTLLARLAQQDDLTGLPNRRRTLQLATDAFERARSNREPLTVGILDLDHFKQINDRFGHAAGDRVLQDFALMGRDVIRETDVFGRWGGEEFLIVLPNTTLDIALGIVERIREAAARISGAPELKVSLSAGLATNENDPARFEDIVASADEALYQAKKDGRDAIRIAQESYDTASTGIRKSLKHAGIQLQTGRHRAHRSR